MKKRTFFILLVFIFLVLAFAGFPFFKKPAEADFIERIGVVEATEVHLSSKISERIESLPLREGDTVQANDVAVRLDDRGIKAEVAQAEANVQRGEANLLSAGAQIEKGKAALQEARRDLNRMTELHREELVSASDLEKAQTRYDLAEAELRAAEAERRSAEAELKQRQANLRLVQIRLGETLLYAPISGVVTLKAFEVGEMVSPGATVLTLIDPESVWVRVDLEEGDIGKLRLGDRAEIFVDSIGGESFQGKVSEVGTAGGFATRRDVTRGRQDIKTFRTKIQAESPGGFLKPGMTARVRIYLTGKGPPKRASS